MTRAALLPTPGDPFLCLFWFEMFEKYWQNEVDKLYIFINSGLEPSVVSFLKKRFGSNSKVRVFHRDFMTQHGIALAHLLIDCQEELVMLIEDDGIIFKNGAVKEQFDRIENGVVDVVGCHRTSATPGISIKTVERFNLPTSEPFLWPNFMFAKRKDLMKTDLHFQNKGFRSGEYCEILDWIPEQDEAMDTNGWIAIQIYNLGLKVERVEQYHRMPTDIDYFARKEHIWNGLSKWCHIGSLSGMMTNWLIDSEGYPLESRFSKTGRKDTITNSDNMNDLGTKEEFEGRVAHLLLCFSQVKDRCEEISEFRDQYEKSIKRLIEVFHLDEFKMEMKIKLYKSLFNI